jgi:hypothetical protein
MTMRAAKHLVYRSSERFTAKIPKGDVRPADGVDRGSTAAVPVGVIVHALPQTLYIERVLAAQ